MRAEDIRNHLRKQPFQPISLFLSDGSKYEVHHPEMMMVGRTEVVIGISGGNGEVFDRFAYCDPVHITRIEPVDGQGK